MGRGGTRLVDGGGGVPAVVVDNNGTPIPLNFTEYKSPVYLET